jgi:hypothetical protein
MMARERMDRLRTMLGYAILLVFAVIAMETFSVAAIQAAPSARVQAINACRAELGKEAKYRDVRACVLRKMKGRAL